MSAHAQKNLYYRDSGFIINNLVKRFKTAWDYYCNYCDYFSYKATVKSRL